MCECVCVCLVMCEFVCLVICKCVCESLLMCEYVCVGFGNVWVCMCMFGNV